MSLDSYSISSHSWQIHDGSTEEHSENLSIHVEAEDYFAMIATVLGFVQETVQDCSCGLSPEMVPLETTTLKSLRSDLNYLHKHFKIVPKEQ